MTGKASYRQICRKGLADKENSLRETHELRVLKEPKRTRWLEYRGVGRWSERKAGARGAHEWHPCPTIGDSLCGSMSVREAGLSRESP